MFQKNYAEKGCMKGTRLFIIEHLSMLHFQLKFFLPINRTALSVLRYSKFYCIASIYL